MSVNFHCGWCGADIDTDDYTVVYNSVWKATEYWLRCPNCGDMIRKAADDYAEVIMEDDGYEDDT